MAKTIEKIQYTLKFTTKVQGLAQDLLQQGIGNNSSHACIVLIICSHY